MKLGIRSKLFLVWLALVAGAALVAELYLSPRLDRDLTDRVRDDLLVRARLCEQEAAALAASGAGQLAWEQLAERLAAPVAARVTFIGRDGRVLGDSSIPESHIGEVESHLERPEVREAVARGWGASVRRSATLGQRMLYAAVPFHAPSGEVAGVVRVAVPLTDVDLAVARLRRLLATAALVMLAAAAVMSSVAAHWVSRTLRHLTRAARTMAGGDLDVRTRLAGNDEIAGLGRALDQLAESLSESLSALRSERDLLDRILNGMREGVLVLGGEGRVLLVNPALREMLEVEAAPGEPVADLVHHPRLERLLGRARAAPAELSEELETGGARPRRLLVHATRLAGEPPGLLAVFVDVTELRRLEAMRREFVANASHELRTPVTALRTAAETLADIVRSTPEDAPPFVDIIERNSERLQRLVEDLLDLSRVESREPGLRLEPVEIAPLVEHVLLQYRERAAGRRIDLVAELAPGVLSIRADRHALEQVLGNLVDNAVKYSVGGVPVTVRAAADGPLVRIAVEDRGPGIAASHLPRLFERFYRVDKSRSRELGGTGLGLAIVKHLTEAMGGTVAVASEVGVGSRFEVTLPSCGD